MLKPLGGELQLGLRLFCAHALLQAEHRRRGIQILRKAHTAQKLASCGTALLKFPFHFRHIHGRCTSLIVFTDYTTDLIKMHLLYFEKARCLC